jgi:chromosome partitioning protein
VLLIDLDPQAHLTLSIGVEPKKLHRSISDALLGGTSLVSVSRESSLFNLDIVPTEPGLALIDKILYGQKDYEFKLRKSIAGLAGNLYDFVLIDCPPSFGPLTLNAMTAADLLIIPVQCEYYAAHALRQAMEVVQWVQQKTNPDLNFRVLVTMYDRRNKISKLLLDQLQGRLQRRLFNTIIEVDTKLKESPAFNQPVTMYAPKTRGAQQYRTLAKELISYGP